MSILIVGADGNMGKRYKSILEHLGKEVTGVDVKNTPDEVIEEASKSDGVIIATPTDTHLQMIEMLAPTKRPILCEKPLTKEPKKLDRLLIDLKPDLTMVFQYEELVDRLRQPAWTYYNYFKHGSDGLAWDCIQIVALAKAELALQDDSPLWKCIINGQKLNIAQMDQAYIKFMRKWLSGQKQDLGFIREAHHKTKEIERTASFGVYH